MIIFCNTCIHHLHAFQRRIGEIWGKDRIFTERDLWKYEGDTARELTYCKIKIEKRLPGESTKLVIGLI